jgi:hypothetical protein
MIEHGFTRYGYGCRCEVCRAAKAAYMRKRRAAARERRVAAEAASGSRYVAPGISHGLSGYQDHGCRCFVCRLSNADSSAQHRKRVRGDA